MKYVVKSLEELADFFADRAAQFEAMSERASQATHRSEYHLKATTLKDVANVIRNTTFEVEVGE